jgi:diguanylate cyclase (GGDEF)-like protein
MNFSVLPDFLAIGGLVLAFGALLKRTRNTRLRYWLVGWVLLLVHIVAQFVSQNASGGVAQAALAVSLIMLLFTSAAFVWASDDMRRHVGPADLRAILLTVTPDALMYVCLVVGVERLAVYAVLTLAGLVGSLWWFCGGRRMDDRVERRLRAVVLVVVYAVQGALLYMHKADMALNWSLFWHYLAAAVFFRLATPRGSGIGVRFTALSFLAWALVFPIGLGISMLWPQVRVESEVWNLPKFLVATGLIFTLLEEQMTQAEHAAQHDDLTGLANRRLFMSRLHDAVLACRRRAGMVALLVIDLDGFKQVNDAHGHAFGDAMLQGVAERFGKIVRRRDTLARLGGDEFAVILPGVPGRAAAQEVAQKLDASLREPFEIAGRELRAQGSIGIAMCPEDAADEARLYAEADRDMYRQKPDPRPVVSDRTLTSR